MQRLDRWFAICISVALEVSISERRLRLTLAPRLDELYERISECAAYSDSSSYLFVAPSAAIDFRLKVKMRSLHSQPQLDTFHIHLNLLSE